MIEIPNHTSPPYSEGARDDALFHYTSADGLIGILQNGDIWGTAYYCVNDESEIVAGKGVLTPVFLLATHKMIEANDPLVNVFSRRGVNIQEYARGFEQTITAYALSYLCAYITCFCKPMSAEDFSHGLLSQRRGYGVDGGYALQFSKKKLLAAVAQANEAQDLNYQLQDVHYSAENSLKADVLAHKEAFIRAYMDFLNELGQPLNKVFGQKTMLNPIASLLGGPLEVAPLNRTGE